MVTQQEIQEVCQFFFSFISCSSLLQESEFRDILDDISQECRTFGNLLSVVIPREKDGFPRETEGMVFLHYSTSEDAGKARGIMGGKRFNNQTIEAEFFDQDKFERKDLM